MVMTAIGVLAGTVCRTQEQVSLVSAVVVILTALVASQVGLTPVPSSIGLSFVPVLGLEAALSSALAGRGTVGAVWIGIASTVLFSALVVRLAARWFRSERLVLRESS
jgi:ABC-type Na+ efflux pump permease subunit